jgi:hypothetical protein
VQPIRLFQRACHSELRIRIHTRMHADMIGEYPRFYLSRDDAAITASLSRPAAHVFAYLARYPRYDVSQRRAIARWKRSEIQQAVTIVLIVRSAVSERTSNEQ